MNYLTQKSVIHQDLRRFAQEFCYTASIFTLMNCIYFACYFSQVNCLVLGTSAVLGSCFGLWCAWQSQALIWLLRNIGSQNVQSLKSVRTVLLIFGFLVLILQLVWFSLTNIDFLSKNVLFQLLGVFACMYSLVVFLTSDPCDRVLGPIKI